MEKRPLNECISSSSSSSSYMKLSLLAVLCDVDRMSPLLCLHPARDMIRTTAGNK